MDVHGIDKSHESVGTVDSSILLPDGCVVMDLKRYLETRGIILEESAFIALSSTLKYFKRGFNVDLLSPFSGLMNRFLGLDNTEPRLGAEIVVDSLLQDDHLFNTNTVFQEFELSQKRKMGGYSKRLPFNEFAAKGPGEYYMNPAPTTFDAEMFASCIEEAKLLLPGNSLRRLDLNVVYEKTIKSTNFGFPFMSKGNSLIDGNLAALKYLDIARSDVERGSISRYPCLMFMRITPSGKVDPINRTVFGAPHSLSFIESMFQTPLLETLRELDIFCENKSQVSTDKVVTNMLEVARAIGCNLIGFDVSGYDKTLPREVVHGAFELIRHWFQLTDTNLLNEIEDYMITCDLVTPGGVFINKQLGVASGMTHTNIVDSLCQYLLYLYTCRKLGYTGDRLLTVQGDDGVWLIPGLDSLTLSRVMSEFGLVANPEKISCSSYYVTFCQRLYMYDYRIGNRCVGIRSAYRTVNRFTCYERIRSRDWRDSHDSLRVIMQLNEMRFNPIHENLTKIMCKVDSKYGLGYRIGGVANLLSLCGGKDAAMRIISSSSWELDRFGRYSSGIFTLSTVKLIEKLTRDTIHEDSPIGSDKDNDLGGQYV